LKPLGCMIISIALLLPFILMFLNHKILGYRFDNKFLAGTAGLIFYIFIVATSFIIDYKLNLELNLYDLNGDGVFSGKEITPEQKEAMRRVVHDTGRSLAPITGAIFSIFYSVGLLVFYAFFSKSIYKAMGRKS